MQGFTPNAQRYNSFNALWLGRVANLAYAQPEQIQQTMQELGVERFALLSDSATDTQGFVAGNHEMTLIAFRGTEAGTLKDWLTDLDAAQVAGPVGQVHKGFYQRGMQSVWQQLTAALASIRDAGQPLWLTGHSLGAAIACLTTAQLLHDQVVPTISGLYTFGQPRCGDPTFAAWFDSVMQQRTFRFVNDNDIVPHLPPLLLVDEVYKHAGTFLYFDAAGQVKKEVGLWSALKNALIGRAADLWQHGIVPPAIEDHLMKNYLNCLQQNVLINPFGG